MINFVLIGDLLVIRADKYSDRPVGNIIINDFLLDAKRQANLYSRIYILRTCLLLFYIYTHLLNDMSGGRRKAAPCPVVSVIFAVGERETDIILFLYIFFKM